MIFPVMDAEALVFYISFRVRAYLWINFLLEIPGFMLFVMFPLNARCCEYALLILENWADAPEIQRAADLYEDLIRCCVADAMSEVYHL